MIKSKSLMTVMAMLGAGIISASAVFADESTTDIEAESEKNITEEITADASGTGFGTESVISAADEEIWSAVYDGSFKEGGSEDAGAIRVEEITGNNDVSKTNIYSELDGQYLRVFVSCSTMYPSVDAAIWSEAGGQDDLIWYPMTKQSDGTFVVSVNLSAHRTAGTYFIHVYSGSIFIDGDSVVLESFKAPEMNVEADSENGNKVIVTIKDAAGYSDVKTAVWGKANGQNDIQWYDLNDLGDGTFVAVADLSQHRENGTFYLHAYGSAAGTNSFIDGKEFYYSDISLSDPSVKTELKGQMLSVTVQNASSFSSANAAVWSSENGQDDLAWYPLAKKQDGSFETVINLGAHKSIGEYIVHVYSENICLGGDVVTLERYTAPVLKAEKAEDSDSGIIVSIENAYGYSDVKAAVWGEKNGQNDLKWYALDDLGNGTFGTGTDLLPHGESGIYIVHVYGISNGRNTFMDGEILDMSSINVPEPSINTTLDGQIIEIELGNAQQYPSAKAAVWSEMNGQDDLVWYPMEKGTDGSFRVKVNLGAHRSTGQFNIHVYSENAFLAGSRTELKTYSTPKLTVNTLSDDTKKVVLTLENAFGYSNIKTAIWGSKNGQNDLRWYDYNISDDGALKTYIDLSDHGETGVFYFHVYGDSDGKNTFLDGLIFKTPFSDADSILESIVINEEAAVQLAKRSGDDMLQISFIGNSITLSNPSDWWWGEWGASASSPANDYVHITENTLAQYVETTSKVLYFAEWERTDRPKSEMLSKLNSVISANDDLIVIELGENVANTANLQDDYIKLIQYCKAIAPGAKIVMVDNFWVIPIVEAAKHAACIAEGISVVDLRDIQGDADYQCGLYTVVSGIDGGYHTVNEPGVGLHPGDKGMAVIGKRVVEAAIG